jgi:hypothetical protein
MSASKSCTENDLIHPRPASKGQTEKKTDEGVVGLAVTERCDKKGTRTPFVNPFSMGERYICTLGAVHCEPHKFSCFGSFAIV